MIYHDIRNKAVLDRFDAVFEFLAYVGYLGFEGLDFQRFLFLFLHLYGLFGNGFYCLGTGKNTRGNFTHKIFQNVPADTFCLAFLFQMRGTGVIVVDGTALGCSRNTDHFTAALPTEKFACEMEIFIAGPDLILFPELQMLLDCFKGHFVNDDRESVFFTHIAPYENAGIALIL
ncbi:MAG TPA: hypothetical protein OIM03_09245 [Veillonellaceae bacterium]|nr:hypothetical protein [Veillonellaceae bacterium]